MVWNVAPESAKLCSLGTRPVVRRDFGLRGCLVREPTAATHEPHWSTAALAAPRREGACANPLCEHCTQTQNHTEYLAHVRKSHTPWKYAGLL